MGTQRITITLPDRLANALKQESRRKGEPVSQLVAEALKQREREELRQRMIEGYIATREENLKIADEFWPIAGETLPDEDWSEYEEQPDQGLTKDRSNG